MPETSQTLINNKPSRLLLVKLSSLGDVVHALPLLDALRQGLGPDAFIGWAVKSKFAGLLNGNPNVSRVYQLKKSGAGDLWTFGKTLRSEAFEVALDAQGLLVSGVVTRLSGARGRVGFDGNRENNRLFLTHPIVPAKQRAHMVDKLMGFCDVLGVPRVAPRPQIYLAQAEAGAAGELLALLTKNNGPVVGCIVGASTPDKVWPAERWAEMARLLIGDGINVVLLGGTSEMETAQTIQNGVGSGAGLLNLAGKTADARLLASVLAQCSVVVGGDSGPTHLAVAVGTPVVGLYGVTDPVRTGPSWGSAPALVLDYAEKDAPPELRRPRHSTLPDAIARIPARAAAAARSFACCAAACAAFCCAETCRGVGSLMSLPCHTAPEKPIRRLLAVNLNYLGDALFTTPALAILKARFPDAELDVLAGERAVAILEGNPHISRLLVRPPHGGSGRAVALMNALRDGQYDAVFLFQSTLSNALLAWAARVPRRIGFAQEGCGPFLTDAVPGRQADEHVVDAYARLARAGVGGESLSPSFESARRLSVALGPTERAFAERFFTRNELVTPVVGLVIGATRPQKRWPEEYFVRLADKLWNVGGMSSVLLGGPDEKEAAERILARTSSPVVSAVGQTTEKELAALIGRLGVVVSGDSGPLHIATAMNTPVVALFGSTDPADTGPWRPPTVSPGILRDINAGESEENNALPPLARATVLYDALPCSPCRKNPTCDGRYDCLRVLTPERVFDAACDLLQTPKTRTRLPMFSPAPAPPALVAPPRPPIIRHRLGVPSPVRVKSIVVLTKHRFMGDTIVAVPLLRATRRAFPDAMLTLLTGRAAATALQNCPYTDRIVTYDPRSSEPSSRNPAVGGQRSVRKALRTGGADSARPDLCLVADRSFRSAAIAWGCGGRIRAGFATERRGFLLTHPIPYDPDEREIECYLNILRAVAPERTGELPYDPTPQLWLTPKERERGAEILHQMGANGFVRPLVGIQPGASYVGKQWASLKFAQVADFLVRRGAALVLLGSGCDEINAANAMKAAMECTNAPIVDLTGKTGLRETMGVLSHLNLFIGNDTGVNHIAASLGVPTVGLFGPTPAHKWGSFGVCNAVLTAPHNDLSCLETVPVIEAVSRLLFTPVLGDGIK